jgi:CDGSH-type Zn-finger protein
MSSAPEIECRPNGPLKVTNLTELRNSKGEPLPTEPAVFLCRCGGSANKPFCDGTHKKNGFSSAKVSDGGADLLENYRGGAITIHDNRAICAHAGICTDSIAAVFKYGSEPWIDPDAADAPAVIAAIRKCPSGALSYSIEAGDSPMTPRSPAITVTKDGPYAIVGGIGLGNEPRGKGASTEHYTLCRCGASKNKPFCDGSHWDAGFKDEKN